jgi:sugar (pentulose or hexulose) kinase
VPVDGGRLFLVGGGARSAVYRTVMADLAQRVVAVPDDAEPVALGACVQAAVRLTGRAATEVHEAWATGGAVEVESAIDAGRAEEIRAAYASARG